MILFSYSFLDFIKAGFILCFVYSLTNLCMNFLKELLVLYISFGPVGEHRLVFIPQTLMTVLYSHARMVETVQMK